MDIVYTGSKLLHIIFASVWFAGNLTFSKDIKQTLQAGAPHTKLLLERGKMAQMFTLPAGAFTVATGFELIFTMGGFKAVPMGIHISLVLAIIAVLIEGMMIMPAWHKITEYIQEEKNMEEIKDLPKKISMFTGITHLLRTIILVLMVIK